MKNELLIEAKVGPCASARQIEEWIDQLLRLRGEVGGLPPALDEINYHLSMALGWLGAKRAGLRCA